MGHLYWYEVLFVLGLYWGESYGGDAAISQNIMDVPSSLPCPAQEDIFPCVCYLSEDFAMDLDCSAVGSEAELTKVFSAHFPFPKFRNFTITGNVNLKVLRAGVLGENSFEGIHVTYGDLEEVEEGAFSGSYSTATKLFLYHNKMTSFPFREIERFTSLTELHANHNNIPEWQPMASKTLQRLHIGNNPFGSLPQDAFVAMPALKKVFFLKSNLQEISSGTFSEIPGLWYVDISRNRLTHIPEYTVVLTGRRSVYIYMNYNDIQTVAPHAISGAYYSGGQIYLRSNQLTEVLEEVWRPLLETGVYLQLTDNPLYCGCDIAWLVLNSTLLHQLSSDTTCANGNLVYDLKPSIYETLC